MNVSLQPLVVENRRYPNESIHEESKLAGMLWGGLGDTEARNMLEAEKEMEQSQDDGGEGEVCSGRFVI